MAYVPKGWATGEVITEEALDHMEQGIANAGGILNVDVLNVDTENESLNKTWQEIYDAITNGMIVKTTRVDAEEVTAGYTFLNNAYIEYGDSNAYMISTGGTMYISNSANGYPVRYFE